MTTNITRRGMLAAGALAALGGRRVWGAEPLAVTNPRATDGDERHEPEWQERLSISVGQRDGDLVGDSDRVVQAACDYVARAGGGTVRLLPGNYVFRNAVHLPSGIRLVGSGAESVISKIASQTVPLAADSDWYDQEITLEQGGDFRVGDGIALQTTNPHNGGTDVIKCTLVARNGHRFKLSDGIRKNLWLTGKPTCSSLFPLLTSEYTSDVVIENLTLDGNAANNANFNGNYGGAIFLQDCNRYTIRGVEARNYNGDGISFQICHDVVVEDCHSHDNNDLGVHPGSGSQRPVIRNCRLERNNIGVFWCWGVKYGLGEGNTVDANRSYGMSIGHNDTDNVIRDNEITRSGKVGILFRDEARGEDFWANRNRIEANRIVDSGGEDGIGIDVQGATKDVVIAGNEVRETRGPKQRTGIRISAAAERITLDENSITGFATPVEDGRV
ncbi:MAG: right-handed parallel beta-helix repeat-containing protein [Pirellulales bacterium]